MHTFAHIRTHTRISIKVGDHVSAFTRMKNTFHNTGDGGLSWKFDFYFIKKI